MNAPLRLALCAEHLTGEQRSFFEALGARARVAIEPLLVTSHAGLYAALESEQAQLGWAPPLVALDLSRCARVAALAAVVRAGRTSFPSVLVARADEDETLSLGDVLGSRIAWVSRLSAAGYVMPRAYLQTVCSLPLSSFREQLFTHSHRASLDAVLEGRVEVAATHARLSRASGALSLPAGAEGLRIVAVTGFVPSELIVAGPSLSPLDRLGLTEALRCMSPWEVSLLGDELAVERFAVQTEHHLDPLARLLASSRHIAARGPRERAPLGSTSHRSRTRSARLPTG